MVTTFLCVENEQANTTGAKINKANATSIIAGAILRALSSDIEQLYKLQISCRAFHATIRTGRVNIT